MRRGATVLLLVLAAAPAPAPAATRWQRPQVLTTGGTNPAVRMDARGRALAVWQQIQTRELRYAWRAPRKRFGRPRALGHLGFSPSYPDPSVALAANGVATAAFLAGDGQIVVRRARPGDPFGQPRRLGTEGVTKTPPVVATDDEGRAVVTWSEVFSQDDQRVLAATVARDGAVSPPVVLGAGQGSTVAMNPSGAAVVAWTDSGARSFASVRPPAGEFGPPSMPPVQPPAHPRAAIDASGRAVVAGSEFLPPGGDRSTGGTTFSVADRDGAFGPQRRLDTGGIVAQLLAEPGGAVDFASFQPDGSRIAFASHRADGTVVGPTVISGPDACAPQLSVARGGNLLAVWTARCERGSFGTASRAALRLRRDGRFGTAVLVGLPGAHSAHGAVTDGDEAVVVYHHAPTAAVHAVVREDRGDDALPPVPALDLDLPDDVAIPDLPAIEVPVRCPRACTIAPGGLLHAGEDAVAAVAGGVTRLRARVRETVEVKFPPEARAAAEDAARRGESAWVSVSLVVRGRSPRPHTITRRVELRAP